jgi:hypothetical protein
MKVIEYDKGIIKIAKSKGKSCSYVYVPAEYADKELLILVLADTKIHTCSDAITKQNEPVGLLTISPPKKSIEQLDTNSDTIELTSLHYTIIKGDRYHIEIPDGYKAYYIKITKPLRSNPSNVYISNDGSIGKSSNCDDFVPTRFFAVFQENYS